MSQQIVRGITSRDERYINVNDMVGRLLDEKRELQDAINKASKEDGQEELCIRLSGKMIQLESITNDLCRLST